MNPRAALRGADVRAALAERPIVTICAWCPDSQERTAALRAQGFDVSHTICPACQVRLQAEWDAA